MVAVRKNFNSETFAVKKSMSNGLFNETLASDNFSTFQSNALDFTKSLKLVGGFLTEGR